MGNREERIRAQYETWLAGHTPVALYVRWYLRHGGARYAHRLFAAMGDERFPRVLDVGCATGFYLKWAFDRGHGHRLLAGVDLSPVMLSEAAARLRPAREAGVEVRLHEASATELPFPDGSFDALICNGVAKYLDDETFSSFLLEAARVLRSGGAHPVRGTGQSGLRGRRSREPEAGSPDSFNVRGSGCHKELTSASSRTPGATMT